MTEQIAIKLNKKIFEPLLNQLHEMGNGITRTHSSLVAHTLFFTYLYMTEKIGDKTRGEICFEAEKKLKPNATYNDLLLEFERKYQEFAKKGVPK